MREPKPITIYYYLWTCPYPVSTSFAGRLGLEVNLYSDGIEQETIESFLFRGGRILRGEDALRAIRKRKSFLVRRYRFNKVRGKIRGKKL